MTNAYREPRSAPSAPHLWVPGLVVVDALDAKIRVGPSVGWLPAADLGYWFVDECAFALKSELYAALTKKQRRELGLRWPEDEIDPARFPRVYRAARACPIVRMPLDVGEAIAKAHDDVHVLELAQHAKYGCFFAGTMRSARALGAGDDPGPAALSRTKLATQAEREAQGDAAAPAHDGGDDDVFFSLDGVVAERVLLWVTWNRMTCDDVELAMALHRAAFGADERFPTTHAPTLEEWERELEEVEARAAAHAEIAREVATAVAKIRAKGSETTVVSVPGFGTVAGIVHGAAWISAKDAEDLAAREAYRKVEVASRRLPRFVEIEVRAKVEPWLPSERAATIERHRQELAADLARRTARAARWPRWLTRQNASFAAVLAVLIAVMVVRVWTCELPGKARPTGTKPTGALPTGTMPR